MSRIDNPHRLHFFAELSGSIATVGTDPIIGYGTLSSAVPPLGTAAEFDCQGYRNAVLTITGTWVGNLLFEATSDGTNWFTINASRPGLATTASAYFIAGSGTVGGAYLVHCSGYQKFRVRATSASGGVTSSVSASLHVRLTAGETGDTSRIIEGGAPNGAVASRNPVVVSGIEPSTGKVRSFAADAKGVIAVQTLPQAVLSGLVAGIAGRSLGIGITPVANVETALRQTPYNEQTTNAQRSFSSSSVADTAAGIGARTLRLTYYSNIAGTVTGPFTEDITLNGLTAVNTVATNICYVEDFRLLTVGSSGSNTGIITMFVGIGGAGGVLTTMAALARQTAHCHHYVASGRVCEITEFYGDSDTATGNVAHFVLRARSVTAGSCQIRLTAPVSVQGSTGSLPVAFVTPREVIGPAVITVYAYAAASATLNHTAEFGYYET